MRRPCRGGTRCILTFFSFPHTGMCCVVMKLVKIGLSRIQNLFLGRRQMIYYTTSDATNLSLSWQTSHDSFKHDIRFYQANYSSFFHSLPSGNMMPLPVHLPSRLAGPPLGRKSIRISGACVAGVATSSPSSAHGLCFSPFMHPGVPSVPVTESLEVLPSPPTARRHPGWLGSAYLPTNTEGAAAALAENGSATEMHSPTAVAAAMLLRATKWWWAPLRGLGAAAAPRLGEVGLAGAAGVLRARVLRALMARAGITFGCGIG
mmetsp:Transcript_28513/g.70263  ORF Transcript_28513/g.70263 Transcript_28513/m.70263 type:complete len:262 (-) Transcript_28513:59-844(-)